MPPQRSSVVNDDTAAQIGLLRDISEMTGGVSEAQLLQLRCWPRVAAPNAKDYEVRLDQALRRVVVAYKFGTLSPPKKDFPHWCGMLDRWIKALLGPAWEVEVEANGRQVHLGLRRIADPDGVRTHQARDPATPPQR